jgi:cell division transport system permease protein
VKIPFLIEGAIQGIISSVGALVILFLAYSFFSFKAVHLFGLPVLDFIFLSGEHALFIIGLGIVLGLLGGLIAVGRFFRV